MALKKREKVLAGATGALLVVFAGVFYLTGEDSSLGDLRQEREDLLKEKSEQTARIRPGQRASAQLNRWKQRALPENETLARDLYGDWLLELVVDRVGLHGADITHYASQPHRGIYTVLPFKIEGRGTLDQLTRFLYEFESTGYMHKIRLLTSTPIKDSDDLKLVIDIDAVCIPGAVHQDKLPVNQPSRLEHGKLDEYLETIVRRKMEKEGDEYRYVDRGGLFAFYRPKAPPEPEPGSPPEPDPESPGFDPSSLTYVSSIDTVDGVPEVWLFVRTQGKTHRLFEGDSFEVGSMRGTIVRIRVDKRDVEIEVDGRHQLVAFGDNLHQGVDLPE